jgi:demethylspheroidene O-methyltransferase
MGLTDRWRALRDRLLSSPAFQQRAARFPLTQAIARREASALFDLVSGFVYSQVLTACVRLDLFERLAGGPLPASELADALAIPLPAMQRLLDAAAALRLLQQRGSGQRFGLGPLGAALRGNPGVVAMIEHHDALYADLADPVKLLREHPEGATNLSRYWAYADPTGTDATPGRVADYSALMAASQPLVAQQILTAYPLARHRCLLDVGGGDGAFASSAARAAPKLKVMVFDLPAVAERARARFAREGLADRARAHGGSVFDDPLPQGADIVSFVRVLHDHDDAAVLSMLRAARAALPAGGTLLVAEPMARTRGAQRMGDAYFGMYLLAMRQGRPRSERELGAMMKAAGFDRVRRHRTSLPLQTSVMSARAA